MLGFLALEKVCSLPVSGVLDVGSGQGFHARVFREEGKKVTTLDLVHPADIQGDYLTTEVPRPECIWACHVLEHQPNPGLFLTKCFADLQEGGYLAVTVPPRKDEIVGGHVTLWNAGILLYQMILAGFDCSQAMVKTYGYNISVVVKKRKANLPELVMDRGDIERLSPFFPYPVMQGFDGNINEVNW